MQNISLRSNLLSRSSLGTSIQPYYAPTCSLVWVAMNFVANIVTKLNRRYDLGRIHGLKLGQNNHVTLLSVLKNGCGVCFGVQAR